MSRRKIGWAGTTCRALAVALVLLPCGAGAQETRPPTAASASSETAPPRPGFAEPVLAALRAALGTYEDLRRELASDRLAGVPAGAERLAGALRLAPEDLAGLAGEVSGVLVEAARAAGSLAEAGDLATARAAFGEVSRHLLRVAEHDPRMVEGWHVFACPMVTTFGKWIQPSQELENPYMGTAMLACGFATDWSVPATAPAGQIRLSAREPGSPEVSGTEPELRPGIPGLKMADVRDHKHLWREIDELQIWERGDRISVAEYRAKVIEKTAHFLELGGTSADELAAVTAAAVADLRESFRRRPAEGETSGVEGLSTDISAAVDRVTSLLGEEPRHRLFAPGCKKWLLRLAFGPSEAKEAREAEQQQTRTDSPS